MHQYREAAKARWNFSVASTRDYINYRCLVMLTVDAYDMLIAQIKIFFKTFYRTTALVFFALLCFVENVTILALNPHPFSPFLCTNGGIDKKAHRTVATCDVRDTLRRIRYTADVGEVFA